MRSFYSGTTGTTPNDPTDLVNYFCALTQNYKADNVKLAKSMINDEHKILLQKYFFNEKSYAIQTVGGQQTYELPYDFSKLKTGTVTVGNLRWTPTEVLTRQEWDQLNVFPYYSDIPANFYIYGNEFNLYPIPSTGSTTAVYTGLTGTLTVGDTITQGTNTGTILTVDTTTLSMQIAVSPPNTFTTGAFTTSGGASGTITSTSITQGNTITFNYQRRVPDLTFTDYTTGTVTATNDSYTITGSATSWLSTYTATAGNVLNLNLWIRIPSPNGDGSWYQIESIETNTSLTLVQPYQGNTVSGASYTIGQMPLLLEDFHNMCIYRPLIHYFSTIQPDVEKKSEFQNLYSEGIKMMDRYVGTKSKNVNLGQRVSQINPNLFWNTNGN